MLTAIKNEHATWLFSILVVVFLLLKVYIVFSKIRKNNTNKKYKQKDIPIDELGIDDYSITVV